MMFLANCSIIRSAFLLITAPPNSHSRPPMMLASVSTVSSVAFADTSRMLIVIFPRTVPPLLSSPPSAVIAPRPACSSASTIVIVPSYVRRMSAPTGPTRVFTMHLYLLSPSDSTRSTTWLHLPTRGISNRNAHTQSRRGRNHDLVPPAHVQ